MNRDLTIRELQVQLPWTIRYSTDYRGDPRAHKDFEHTLVHVQKALGKLAGMVDDCDHNRAILDDPELKSKHEGYVADLVICALRAANVFPGSVIDLQRVVEDRLENKNSIKLLRADLTPEQAAERRALVDVISKEERDG